MNSFKISVCVHLYILYCVCVCMCVCVCVCVCASIVCVSVCVFFVCVSCALCVCVCMCVSIFLHLPFLPHFSMQLSVRLVVVRLVDIVTHPFSACKYYMLNSLIFGAIHPTSAVLLFCSRCKDGWTGNLCNQCIPKSGCCKYTNIICLCRY